MRRVVSTTNRGVCHTHRVASQGLYCVLSCVPGCVLCAELRPTGYFEERWFAMLKAGEICERSREPTTQGFWEY